MSIISSAGGLARIVGPLVGGFLSKPEENLVGLVKLMPWLRKVRYWIPCFVGSVLCLFTAIFTIFAAPETLSRESAKKAKEQKKKNSSRVKQLIKDQKQGKQISKEDEMLIALSKDSYFDLILNKRVLIACSLYAVVCLVQSGQDSLLPLFLINPSDKGGFEFDQTDIGWLYTGIGPVQIIFNPLIFPLVARLWTYSSIYSFTGILYSVLLFIYPVISYFNTSPIPVRWFVVLFSTMACIFARLINFTASMVLINNSTYSDFRGKVNGLGQVLAAIGRFLGPSMASSLFAWSISGDHPFPFNSGFTYYILGIIMLFTALFVYTLPKDINTALGRIADVFHSNDVEMKEVKEEGNVVEVKQETEIVSSAASDPVKV